MLIRTQKIIVSFVILCLNSPFLFSEHAEREEGEILREFITLSDDIIAERDAGADVTEPLSTLRNLSQQLMPENGLNTIFKSKIIYKKEPLSFTPLCQAVWLDDLELVRLLLKNGADVNGYDTKNSESDTTPLYIATGRRISYEIFKTLLDAGADPNMPTKRTKNIPLLESCDNKYIERTNDLLNCGANPNCFRIRGQTIETPLYVSMCNFCRDIDSKNDPFIDMQLAILLMLFNAKEPEPGLLPIYTADSMQHRVYYIFKILIRSLVDEKNLGKLVYTDKEGIVRLQKTIPEYNSSRRVVNTLGSQDLWNGVVELNKKINLVSLLERAVQRNLEELHEQQREAASRRQSVLYCFFSFFCRETDSYLLDKPDCFATLPKVLKDALNNDSLECPSTFRYSKSARQEKP